MARALCDYSDGLSGTDRGAHLSPEFFIGIDGGGSRTRARLQSAQDHRTLGDGEAGASGLTQGVAQAWRHLSAAIDAAFADAGMVRPDDAVIAVGAGLAGARDAALRAEFVAAAPAFAALALDTDGHAALLGAHRGGPGLVLIAGTGSVGEALLADGRRRLVGGWGYPVGDEGSGAWLGLRAMALAQRAVDGRAEAGALARAVRAATGDSEDAMRAWCIGAGQARYAQLAPLVFEHEADDPAAAALVTRAIAAIATLAAALDPSARLPVAVRGSVGERLAPRLAAPLRARCIAAGDATDGALLLVRRSLGLEAAR